MRTEGTTGVADQSLDWDRDAIITVLLEGVEGGREGCEALVCEATEGRTRPRVGVAVMNIEWDYSYYQPWSDNEWLVDEMIAMREETLTVQNKDITMQ